MRIVDGTPEDHPTPLPLDAGSSPAVAPVTPRYPSGNQQGGVLADISGVDFTGEVAAAMSLAMSADAGRRTGYEASMKPLAASYGDLMPVSNPPLDPGAAPGEAEPWG